MNLKEIKEVLQLMSEYSLTEIEVEKDGLKLKLKRGSSGRPQIEEYHEPSIVQQLPGQPSTRVVPAPTASPATDVNITIIKSPMVGTFYSAPAPDQPVYAAVGKSIKEGDVLCIVEAMKLMNEIKSDISGTIVEILCKNGQAVEFDQPLFKVRKG